MLEFITTTCNDGPVDPRPEFGLPYELVIRNRNKLLSRFGIDIFVRMDAVHGTEILVIDENNKDFWKNKHYEGRPRVDSFITGIKGVCLECDKSAFLY